MAYMRLECACALYGLKFLAASWGPGGQSLEVGAGKSRCSQALCDGCACRKPGVIQAVHTPCKQENALCHPELRLPR